MRRTRFGLSMLALAGSGVWLATCSTPPPPDTLGEVAGSLAPCTTTSCVHTGLRRPEGTRGIYLTGAVSMDETVTRLREIVGSLPRTTLVRTEDMYFHAEARTPILRAVDDLELFIAPDGELIVRSARRGGGRDFGANAERVEELRDRLLESGLTTG